MEQKQTLTSINFNPKKSEERQKKIIKLLKAIGDNEGNTIKVNELAKSLSQEEPRSKFEPYDGDLPLEIAICHGNSKAIRALAKAGININQKNHNGKIPIQLAIELPATLYGKKIKSYDIVAEFIKLGVNPNLKLTWDMESQGLRGTSSLLHFAVCFYCNKGIDGADVIELLVESGANIHQVDDFGRTPLHLAITASFSGDNMNPNTMKIIKCLLRLGSVEDIDVKDHNGLVPLGMVSTYLGLGYNFSDNHADSFDCSNMLREAIQKKTGRKLLPQKTMHRLMGMIVDGYYRFDKVIIWLKNHKNDGSVEGYVTGPGLQYTTLLCHTIVTAGIESNKGKEKTVTLVKALLEAGAKTDQADQLGRGPLHLAALCGSVLIIKILLDSGAKINEYGNPDKYTPLHCCTTKATVDQSSINVVDENDKVEAIKILLTNGADLFAKTKSGETALDLAKKNGFTLCAAVLEKKEKELRSSQIDIHSQQQEAEMKKPQFEQQQLTTETEKQRREHEALELEKQRREREAEVKRQEQQLRELEIKKRELEQLRRVEEAERKKQDLEAETKRKDSRTIIGLAEKTTTFTASNQDSNKSMTLAQPSPKEIAADDFRLAIQQAAEAVKKQFLGQLESEYQMLFSQYQRMGKEAFEKQYQSEQTRFLSYLKSQEVLLQQQSQNHQRTFQDNLQSVLAGKSLDALSDQMALQLQSRLGDSFSKSIQGLLDSKQYQEEIQRLQQGILQRIQERQGQMALEMVYVQTEQKQIRDQTDPIYKKHQQKQQALAEQQELLKTESVKVFYNTIEKVLGSQLMSAMSLASGMIKRTDTKKEQAVSVGINVTGKILDCVPMVGGIAKTVTTAVMEISEAGLGYYVDKQQEKKYQNTLDSIIRLEDAMVLAELVARRLAQSYQHYITTNYLSPEQTQAAAENAANIVYDCIKAGELKDLALLDDKIDYLIKKVQKEAAEQKTGFFKKPNVFKEAVSPQQFQQSVLATAAAQQKQQQDLETLKSQVAYVANQMLLSPPTSPLQKRFSLLDESSWTEASLQIKTKFSFEMQRSEKKLTLKSQDEKSLEQLGDTIKKLFGDDIHDWDVENNQLVITAEATQKTKKLEVFLQNHASLGVRQTFQ